MPELTKPTRAEEAEKLKRVTEAPFKPSANRKPAIDTVSFATTEVCELSCVFCHFNGPNATKKAKTLDPELVKKGLRELPPGVKVYFGGSGDISQDPNALEHLRASINLGHPPEILTHGQSMPPETIDEMLSIGVRGFRFSVDHIEARPYAKIRRGGELKRVLEAIDYLRQRKHEFPEIEVGINCALVGEAKDRMDEFTEFWSTRVDVVYYHAEYYDELKFRNLLYVPDKRNDCEIQLSVLPSGQISPCCAIGVKAHETDMPWLPNIRDTSLQEAYEKLSNMYEDPNSELGKVCAKCQWWVLWSEHRDTCTPFMKVVRFSETKTGVDCAASDIAGSDIDAMQSKSTTWFRRALAFFHGP